MLIPASITTASEAIAYIEAHPDVSSADLKALASQMSVKMVPGTRGILLYSGSSSNIDTKGSLRAYQVAEPLGRTNGLTTIGQTEAGKLLNSGIFQTTLESAVHDPIKFAVILEGSYIDGVRQADGLFDIASTRMVAAGRGSLRVYAPDSNPNGVWQQSEWEIARNNPDYDHYEGFTRSDLANYERDYVAAGLSESEAKGAVRQIVERASGINATMYVHLATDATGKYLKAPDGSFIVGTDAGYFAHDPNLTAHPLGDEYPHKTYISEILDIDRLSYPKLEHAAELLEHSSAFLNKLGTAGVVIDLTAAASRAAAAAAHGDTPGSIKIMTDWGTEFAGSWVGGALAVEGTVYLIGGLAAFGPPGIIAAGVLTAASALAGSTAGTDIAKGLEDLARKLLGSSNKDHVGSIDTIGAHQLLPVTLKAGFIYQFDAKGSAAGGGSLVDPHLSLREGSGALITSSSSNGRGDALITYVAKTSGTFYLDISGGSGKGGYTVTEGPADDYAGSIQTSGKLNPGSNLAAGVQIVGDHDYFVISLKAGFSYQFDVKGSAAGGGSLVDPYISLRNSNGGLHYGPSSGGTSGDARITFTPTTSGTYYIDASAHLGGTGSYTVSVSPQDDYAATIATSGKLNPGSNVTAGIQAVLDHDYFAISLKAGFSYQFDVKGNAAGGGSLVDPYISLRNPDGGLHSGPTSGGTSGDARITFTPTTSGTYYIDASAHLGGTGSYTVSVSPQDDYAATIATSGKLNPGSNVTAGIQAVLDHDYFAISLKAGFSYQFDVKGNAAGGGSLVDPYISLRNPDGGLHSGPTSGGTSGDARITFTPTTSGTYYIDASAHLGGTGSYTVSVSPQDDYAATIATSGAIGSTGSVSGHIEAIQDHDFFKISLQAGIKYQFDLKGNAAGGGSLVDPYISLRNPDGGLHSGPTGGGASGDAKITFTPTTSGTYYIDASAHLGGTGSYTLTSTIVPKATATTALVSAKMLAEGVGPHADAAFLFRPGLEVSDHHQQHDLLSLALSHHVRDSGVLSFPEDRGSFFPEWSHENGGAHAWLIDSVTHPTVIFHHSF